MTYEFMNDRKLTNFKPSMLVQERDLLSGRLKPSYGGVRQYWVEQALNKLATGLLTALPFGDCDDGWRCVQETDPAFEPMGWQYARLADKDAKDAACREVLAGLRGARKTQTSTAASAHPPTSAGEAGAAEPSVIPTAAHAEAQPTGPLGVSDQSCYTAHI
jgi:hypothetical protein